MGANARIDEAILTFISATSEQEVFQTLVDVTYAVVPADVCKVATVDGGVLVPQVRSDQRPVDPTCRLPLTGTTIGNSVTSGTPLFMDDIQDTRSATTSKDSQNHDVTRALFSVPVGDDTTLIGSAPEPDVFDSADQRRIERLVCFAEAALSRLRDGKPKEDGPDRFDEFGAILTHDLRGPLGVARAYTEQSRNTGNLDTLDDVVNALDRLDQIIGDLHILVHAEREIDDTESVSLASVATDCWNAIDTESATLRIDKDREFVADRSQLRHLFENLFRNAIEHNDRAVTITVGHLHDGFYVEDTGAGLPDPYRKDIFEYGFTTSDSGSGYGLSIVKRVTEAHGWTITITEGTEGGARFEITGVRSHTMRDDRNDKSGGSP